MYYAYLAVLWNDADASQCSVARLLLNKIDASNVGWTRKLTVPGAVILDTARSAHPLTAHSLGDRRGVLFGRLFHQRSSARVSPESLVNDNAFHTLSPERIASHLVQNYWGSYVAFAVDPRTSEWIAIRDCSGMLPCFTVEISGVSVFFADIRHLLELHDSFEVNWRYLTAFLSWSHLQIRETALLGVQEVLAGEVIVSSASRKKTDFAWSPISICESTPLLNAESAQIALREATQQSVSAWASMHTTLIHKLSGGFDSAMVLAAIMRTGSPPNVVCVTRYGNAPGEDERRFARSAARLHDVRVFEVPWDQSGAAFDERCLATPITAKPMVPYFIDMLDASFWNKFCQVHGCDGITTGQGGDHLFMSAPTAFGVPDCFKLHGLGRQFWDSVSDAAFLTGQSFWHVLASAFSASVDRKHFARHAKYTPNECLLCPDAIFPELPHYILPPWCLASGHLSPGKRFHVLNIADVVNRHRPMPGLYDIDELHPLLSQPLLDTALSIPLHLLYAHGKRRGLARDAFRDYLPQEILSREVKGHTGTYTLGLVRDSLPFVRQLLLDGHFVKRGVLSRDTLAQYLSSEEPLRAKLIFPLLACISAELWVQSWFHCVRQNSRRAEFEGAAATALTTDRTRRAAMQSSPRALL